MSDEVGSKSNRQFFRLQGIDVPIDFKIVSELLDIVSAEYKQGHLRDISAGGVSFVTNENIEKGMEVRIKLPVNDDILNLMGKVVHISESSDESDEFEISLKFVFIDDHEQDKIVGFIFKKQLEMRRKGLR